MRWWTSTAIRRASRNAAGIAAIFLLSANAATAEPVTGDRAQRLDHLLRHDCGSCHGMTMKGGLGPALLPADLEGKNEEGLIDMILQGNPERAMPPWGQLLSRGDARWMVRRLKNGMQDNTSNGTRQP